MNLPVRGKPKIGVLVIGQTPRPDLVAPVKTLLPQCEIVQAGALDALEIEDLPPIAGDYPLVTRMRSGTIVMVEERFLIPRLQIAVERLARQGVVATILLCAGTFADVQSVIPLIKPFDVGQQTLKQLSISSVGFIAPVVAQERPIRERWERVGIRPNVWTATLDNQDAAFQTQLRQQIAQFDLDAIVLDYVGHPVEQVERLQSAASIPVLDLGQLALKQLAEI